MIRVRAVGAKRNVNGSGGLVGRAPDSPVPEQRRTSRKRSFRAALVGRETAPAASFCLVRDLSPSGAKLAGIDVAGLPDTFELQISGRDRWYRAEVVWRGEAEVGVRFAAEVPRSDPALARIG